MKEIRFLYSRSLIDESELKSTLERIKPEIAAMNLAAKKGYDTDAASINLPVDKEILKQVKALVKKKQLLKPEYLVIISIGGAFQCPLAAQEAVLGKNYNELGPKLKVLYASTVDSDAIAAIISLIERPLKKKKNVLLAIISKSGTTTESIAMAEVLIEKVKKHRKDYSKSVVVITDNHSRLMSLAEKNGFDTITIPKKIGDRYSVLSPLGLFPLTMLGIKSEQLLLGAASMRERCLSPDLSNNPAALSAAISYLQFKDGKNIHDTFLFSTDLESLGKWCRQISAESLGKEKDRNGIQVFTGPTPTVSIGSLDLHISTQLYLGGPFDKYTMFVKVEKNKSHVRLPDLKEYDDVVEGIQGLELKEIMDAIYQGTLIAFEKAHRPYSEVILPDKSESSVAQFMQFKMFETIYLASLLNVNPFDQPNVESYKEETRKILAGKKQAK